MKLTLEKLRQEAINFSKQESNITHDNLIGVTDGKAVGTYIEHKFSEYLKSKYDLTIGSSARGIDLPDHEINTDIKVTSIKKPQSSSPFKNIEQKVYGLGYNLLVFIYEKTDINNRCYLNFKNCLFIEDSKTADHNLTKILRTLVNNNVSAYEIADILQDYNVPGDNSSLLSLAEKIISNPPEQGYLTISNAFQWRLKYNNILSSDEDIDGVHTYEDYREKEFGDYQTPLFFTDIVCEYLKNDLKITPEIIIEPTCGVGNFLKSSSKAFPDKQLIGIDIDKKKLGKIDPQDNLKLIHDDIFTFNFNEINKDQPLLIIGNPPWATNTELSKINSKNLPNKTNFKNNPGFEALTGTSNFDICEYIILKIIDEFKNFKSTLAFLCKTTVSRNVFIELINNNIPYSFVKQLNFDSAEVFKIDADACLFVIQFGGETLTDKTCEVADITNPSQILSKFGFKKDKFYSNVDDIPDIDGSHYLEWRQGVKHDCAKVMELNCENGQLINKNDTIADIEHSLVYPLLKSSNLKKAIITETQRYILITQQKIRQDTSYIESEAPKTWQYLNDNREYFDKRRSSIYNNTPDFSIFGIGDYSFKEYKVAISGFYKEPIFCLVHSEKTMMLDDTCYFLSFDDYDSAYITMLILNSDLVKKFLKNIAFLDSKRPYSKKVLKRIDIGKCLDLLDIDNLKEVENKLKLDNYITKEQFNKYKNSIK